MACGAIGSQTQVNSSHGVIWSMPLPSRPWDARIAGSGYDRALLLDLTQYGVLVSVSNAPYLLRKG